ncbi:hypothetical protein BB936_03545 [Yersinia enterocolitica]|nr:hypothetical protein BB936_03545 [Yersinia enterocolitica]
MHRNIDRGQRTEDRGQRTEDRGQRTEEKNTRNTKKYINTGKAKRTMGKRGGSSILESEVDRGKCTNNRTRSTMEERNNEGYIGRKHVDASIG